MKYLAIVLWLLPLRSQHKSPRADSAPAPAAAAATAAMSDAEIADKVYAEILNDESLRYDAAEVGLTVRDGVVTLLGIVHRDTIRLRMAQVARHASGGCRIVNLITVQPS
jgi:osmotically-inducible protein OsmY